MRNILTAVAAILFSGCIVSAAEADPYRILLLQSFSRTFSPFSDFSNRFREELGRQSPQPTEFYEASVDLVRPASAQQEKAFVDYLSALFDGRDLDLVVTVGAPAARFSQRTRSQLFPSTPLLITAADQRVIANDAVTANDALLPIKFDFPRYVENILQVLPETTTMAVVVGNSPFEKFWMEEMRREFQPFTNRLNIIWLNDLSFNKLLQRVATLPPRSAIFYGLFSTDADGVPYEQGRALSRIHETANAPIFSYIDSHFGQGIVGGPLISNIELSQLAASLAVRILHGEPPAEIKVPPMGLATPEFDVRELRRWGINEATLPSGSILQFREPTDWERFHWQIYSVGGVMAILSVLVMELVFERHRRHSAELLARQRMSELAQMDRVATAGELSASIAHEISQPLAAMVTSANAGLRWLSKAAPNLDEVREALEGIVSDGHRGSDLLRTIKTMFKEDKQEFSLVDVNALIREVLTVAHGETQRRGVLVRPELAEKPLKVLVNPIQLQQVVINLIMNGIEAMTSITDRARTLRVRSKLHEPNGVLITVEDSGIGIDPKDASRIFETMFTTKSSGMGMGLSICQSIIEVHNGRIWASPQTPHGSVFHVFLPIGEASGK